MGILELQLAELEEILLWYVEKYGLSDRAREYFANKSICQHSGSRG